MNHPLQVICIGAGYFAQFHLEAWQRLAQVNLAVIVEQDLTRHKELAQLYPHTTITDSVDSTAQGIDAAIVDIITPPDTHETIISLAMEHWPQALIICQKPFCGSIDTAQHVTRHAAQLNRSIVVHENFRFQPWYVKINSLLQENSLGEVLCANFRLRPGDGQGPEAYLARQPYFQQMNRFLIHETGIHWVDVFRFLFGEPAAVSADLRQINPHIAGEDAGSFTFHYDNGLRAIFDGNRLLDHAADNTRHTMGEMLIEGTQATLHLNGDGDIHIRSFGSKDNTKVNYHFEALGFGADCVYKLQQHVVDHLIHGTQLHNRAADYLNNLQLEEHIYTAANSGSLQQITKA